MFTYLYKITVDIEELEGEALCALMDEVWEQVRSGSLSIYVSSSTPHHNFKPCGHGWKIMKRQPVAWNG